MKIGFIGLGLLGKAIVQRLISQQIDLIVWNRTRSKAEGLKVEIADCPADVVTKTQIVFLNLSDSEAVESIIKNSSGLLEGEIKGKVIIDTTTNHFEKVVEFHKIFKMEGAIYLEVPVIGSVVPALKGELTALISGDKVAFEKTRHLIEAIASSLFFLEKPGLATKMKLINNMVLGVIMTALSEAVVLGEESGLDKNRVIDILSAGAGNSLVLNAKKSKLIEEDFSPHFSASMLNKDLRYFSELIQKLKKPSFVGSLINQFYTISLKEDFKDKDFSVIYRIIKEM